MITQRLIDRILRGEGGYLLDVPITPGVGAAIKTESIGGSDYQIIKPAFGAIGSATDVSTADPFPIVPGLRTSEQYTRLALSIASSGTNDAVAASVSNFWRIYGIVLVAAGAVTLKISDGTVDVTGVMSLVTGVPLVLMPQGEPLWVSGAVNRPMRFTLGGAVQVSGTVWYTLAP